MLPLGTKAPSYTRTGAGWWISCPDHNRCLIKVLFVALGISCPLPPSCRLIQCKSIGNYNNQYECVHVRVFKIVEDIHRIKYFCSFFSDFRTRTVLWTFFLNRNVPSVHSYSNMCVLKNVYFDLFWVTSLVDPHLGPVCII